MFQRVFGRVLLGGLIPGLAIFGGFGFLPNSGSDLPEMRPMSVHQPLRPSLAVAGLTPTQVKVAYGLTAASDGSGTIAVIDAYDDPAITSDLATFNKHFGLKSCTVSSGCFMKHKMSTSIAASTDWSGEIALDVEWAHAVAPGAKILLVEATSASTTSLMKAVDYARKRSDVVAVSMSWGGSEFSTEANYDSHFASAYGASFFASSGDDGHGVSWPAASARVIAVGGTTLGFTSTGKVSSETAWSGSGGGESAYVPRPDFQTSAGVKTSGRAVPDVAYDANPNSGFQVYDSTGSGGWVVVGGTSAGAPQWAALRAIKSGISLGSLYGSPTKNYRDITSGTNGSCGSQCNAKKGYDLVTGLGTPLGNLF